MGFKGGRSGRRFAAGLKRRADRIKTETDLVARTAEREIKAEFVKRDRPVKRVNKQDSPSGRVLTPSRGPNTKTQIVSGNGFTAIKLEARAFYTGARSMAVKAILTTLGLIPILFRKSLIVRRRLKAGTQGPIQQQRLSFAGHPLLARWAARADKGSQYLAHVLRLRGEALNRIVMQSTIKVT